MDKKAVIKLKEFKKKARKDLQLEQIIFFGSRATKKFRKDSDIDLILVSKKFKKLDFFDRIAKTYNYWNLDYPVDFICYTPDEFNKLKKGITIVRQALEEGIII